MLPAPTAQPVSPLMPVCLRLTQRRLFGLRRAEEVAADGTMTYEMPRAPEGYLDILFLDEDLRVTRGNRGSIVIAERLPG